MFLCSLVVINTFFPAALQIGKLYHRKIVNGTSALVGIFFVHMGAQLDLKCAPQAMKTGFAITIAKFAVSVAINFVLPIFSTTVCSASGYFTAAASNSNGALFGALTKTLRSRSGRGGHHFPE